MCRVLINRFSLDTRYFYLYPFEILHGTATRIFLNSIQVCIGWRLSDKDHFVLCLTSIKQRRGEQTFIFSPYLKSGQDCLHAISHNAKLKGRRSKSRENILSDPLFSLYHRLNLNGGWANKTDQCRWNRMWSPNIRSLTIKDEYATKKCCNNMSNHRH